MKCKEYLDNLSRPIRTEVVRTLRYRHVACKYLITDNHIHHKTKLLTSFLMAWLDENQSYL